MTKKNIVLGGVVFLLLVIAGVAYVLRPSEEASSPIQAVPVLPKEEETSEVGEAVVVEEDSEVNDVTKEPESEAIDLVVFSIVQKESEVNFILDEELRGEPNTVVGVTDQVAGEIALDFNNPANSIVGTITINARTFTTGSNIRNRMINNQILDTSPYEFITFAPTAIEGLEDTVKIGETYAIQITGDLTIRNVTNLATFEMSLTLVSESRLEGTATTQILRTDYGLIIPSVRSVANVTNEVQLIIMFVAVSTG